MSQMSKRKSNLALVHRQARCSYWIVPTTREHLLVMATKLRVKDLEELEAAYLTPRRALWRGFRRSLWTRTAFVDGEIAAIWGLNAPSAIGFVGVPWLLTAPALERAAFAFIREAKKEVARMLEQYPTLDNYVLASYQGAIRFLKIMGFTLEEPEAIGRNGELFRRFHKER